MKKTLLIIMILLAGCKTPTLDERGRLEKVRIQIPAFIDIEFEYYKDKENIGKETIRNAPTNPTPFAEWPELMPRSKK